MKSWKCPNCYNEKDTDEHTIIVLCMCGYYMKQIKLRGKKDVPGRIEETN